MGNLFFRKKLSALKRAGLLKYRIFVGLSLLLLATVVVGFFASRTVSKMVVEEAQQKVLWEARLYAEQLQRKVVRVASRLDTLVSSSSANTKDGETLTKALEELRSKNIGIVRAWIAYPDGTMFFSSNTVAEHIKNRPVWNDFLQGKRPESFSGFFLRETNTIISSPFVESEGGSALVTLISIFLRGNKLDRVGGIDLNISQAVADSVSGVNWVWDKAPVRVYTSGGLLIASPLEEGKKPISGLRNDWQKPIVHYFINHPGEEGVLFYEEGDSGWVSAFVRDKNLGMVTVVSHSSEQLLSPVHAATTRLVGVALLSIITASVLAAIGYSTELEARELKYRSEKAELRALRAYINPHFLFNTLSLICSLANKEDYQLIPGVVKAIGEIFRYIIREPENMVTLREELSHVNNYVMIQKLRFGTRFTYQEDVPDELMETHMPKFIIQPLVENCFVHGVEETLDLVHIKVRAENGGGYLKISVEDDGPDFDPEILQKIEILLNNPVLEETSPHEIPGIGILNTHYRLFLMYGNSSGITVTQKDGLTTVTAVFPCQNHPGETF
ncbi:MAG: sensor histidine kinase [Atribacterota bacterium]|nr:sensor histidine kinase [Atribacterota bacterium]